jgi:EAL domain-containing protein (putative c-di-GMP-specific phosphodiesterase class I)
LSLPPNSPQALLQLLQQGLARLSQAESEGALIRTLDDVLQQLPGVACAMLTIVDHLPQGQPSRYGQSSSRTWLLALPTSGGFAARAALRPMTPLEFPIRPGQSAMLCVYADPARPLAATRETELLDALRILTLTLGAYLARVMPGAPVAEVLPLGMIAEPRASLLTAAGPLSFGEQPEGDTLPGRTPMDRHAFMERVDAHLHAATCLEAALLRVDLGQVTAPTCEADDCRLDCRYPDRRSLLEELSATLPPELPAACLRPGEFAVLLAPGLLGQVAETPALPRLEASVRALIQQRAVASSVEPRLSMALWPRDGVDAMGLLRYARSCPREGVAGRPDHDVARAERVSMETELRALVSEGRIADELRIVYQPQVGLADMRLCGVEALLRWRSPRFGEVAPAVFMPLLEESGLIVQVGEWVVREACRQVHRWAGQGVRLRRLAVNLSAGQLRAPATSRALEQVLVETGLMNWCQLEVEVTESTLMSDTDSVIDQLRTLTGLGVRVAVDDFGRGTCALGWLESFPISGIKVDPLFLGELDSNPDHAQLARAMFDLGRALNLRVSAEGVETASQLDFIRSNGCEEAQGYYFARPLEAEHFLVSTQQPFH